MRSRGCVDGWKRGDRVRDSTVYLAVVSFTAILVVATRRLIAGFLLQPSTWRMEQDFPLSSHTFTRQIAVTRFAAEIRLVSFLSLLPLCTYYYRPFVSFFCLSPLFLFLFNSNNRPFFLSPAISPGFSFPSLLFSVHSCVHSCVCVRARVHDVFLSVAGVRRWGRSEFYL